MDLNGQFKLASDDVKGLTKRPSDNELLQLYSLFKQASDGDATGKRPGMLNIVARKKYDAWAELSGKSSDQAKQDYVTLVESLKNKYA